MLRLFLRSELVVVEDRAEPLLDVWSGFRMRQNMEPVLSHGTTIGPTSSAGIGLESGGEESLLAGEGANGSAA